jgi:hypothetical protein
MEDVTHAEASTVLAGDDHRALEETVGQPGNSRSRTAGRIERERRARREAR